MRQLHRSVSVQGHFYTIAGTGAGYEHTDDGMQSGGAQNFSEGGGMKGAGMNSGMMPQGMKEGQGERHHGGQQGGGMQVCVYIHMQPLTELWSTNTSKNILQLLCHCIHATHPSVEALSRQQLFVLVPHLCLQHCLTTSHLLLLHDYLFPHAKNL